VNYLAQDRDKWHALVNMAVCLSSKKRGELTYCLLTKDSIVQLLK